MAIDMSMIDISLTQSRSIVVVSPPPPYLALPPPALASDQVQSPLFSDLSSSSSCGILSSPVSKRALFASSDDDDDFQQQAKVKRRFVIKRGKLVESNTLVVTDPWPDSASKGGGRWILRGFRGIEQVSPGYMMDPRLVRILSVTSSSSPASELVRRYPRVSCLKFPAAVVKRQVERRDFIELLNAFQSQLHSLWIASLTVASFVPWIETSVSQFVLTHEITDEVKLPPIPQWYDKVHDSGSLIMPCVSSRGVFQSYLPLLAKSHHSLSRLYLASFLHPFHAQDTSAVLAGGIVTHHLWLCSRGTRPDDADDQPMAKPMAMVLAPTLQTLWLDSFAASQFFLREAHVPYDLETLFLCLAPFGRDPPSMEKALDKCVILFKRLRQNQVPTLIFKLMWPPLFDAADDDEWTVKCLYNLRQAFVDTEETTTITFVPQRPLLNESDRVAFVQFVQKVFEYRRGIVCKTAPFIPHIGDCMAQY